VSDNIYVKGAQYMILNIDEQLESLLFLSQMFINYWQFDCIVLHVHSFLFILLKDFNKVVVLQLQLTACKCFVN